MQSFIARFTHRVIAKFNLWFLEVDKYTS